MFDWNDLKAFLAVARGGSTLAASKALAVNQTTVARRVESLEAALSLKLFERGQSGSRLTEAGRDLLAEGEKVERAAQNFDSRAKAHQRGMAGSIRVTCIEILANMAVTPAIGEFRKLHPEVQVDLMITDQPLDLTVGEADLAVRAVQSLPNSDLVARKISEYEFALYCDRDYAERKGVPTCLEDLANHDLIGGDHLEAALRRMNTLGRIPVCGFISGYNSGHSPVSNLSNIIYSRVMLRGFVATDFMHLYADFQRDMRGWLKAGRVKYQETVMDGIASAPAALIGLMAGENSGKMLVRLAS